MMCHVDKCGRTAVATATITNVVLLVCDTCVLEARKLGFKIKAMPSGT